MSWSFGWRPYVPVAERRANAARELARLGKKSGAAASSVMLNGRKIAGTFWGKAWCDNLEAYSDYANRLPRGRTYVRNGSVVDLQIAAGKVSALVSGSSLYRIEIKIKPLAASLWKSIQTECAGKIDSLIELLQGKLSSSVMQIVTRRERGLFPTLKEIDLDCSCPDWAGLCKHVAAALYGIGARLDQKPELLFLLRGVDAVDLISEASASEAVRQTAATLGAPALTDKELTEVFDIELADSQLPSQPATKLTKAEDPLNQTTVPMSVRTPGTKPPKKSGHKKSSIARGKMAAPIQARRTKDRESASVRQPASQKLSAAARSRIAAAMKVRWAKYKKTGGK